MISSGGYVEEMSIVSGCDGHGSWVSGDGWAVLGRLSGNWWSMIGGNNDRQSVAGEQSMVGGWRWSLVIVVEMVVVI